MIIHILLVAISSIQVLLIISELSSYAREQMKLFYFWFLDQEGSYNELNFNRYNYIFKIDDLKDMVNQSIQTYYNLENDSLGEYLVPKDIHGDPVPVQMDITYLEGRWNPSLPLVIYLSPDDISPFDLENDKLKEALTNVSTMSIIYPLNYTSTSGSLSGVCYSWVVSQNYNMQERSVITLSLGSTNKMCSKRFDYGLITWCNVAVSVLSIISIILAIKYIYNFGRLTRKLQIKYGADKREKERLEGLYARMKNKNDSYKEYLKRKRHSFNDKPWDDKADEKELNWENVKFSDKLTLLNSWNIVTIVGNATQMIGSIAYLFDRAENVRMTTILLGIGCLLAWINIIRYLKYIPSYFTVYETLKNALPMVVKLLLGILPIYIGFALFGSCVFWESERFKSVDRSIFSQFAMLNGDMIFDSYMDLSFLMSILGQAFLYIYILMFICVVLNVFISTIQLTYQNAYKTIKQDKRLERNYLNVATKEKKLLKDEISKKTLQYIIEKECIDFVKENEKGSHAAIHEMRAAGSAISEEIFNILRLVREKYKIAQSEGGNQEELSAQYEAYVHDIKQSINEVRLAS